MTDEGTFLLEDWGDPSALASRLLIIGPDGIVRVDEPFAANVISSALSDRGRFAVAQLANSGTEDGGRLVLLDVDQGSRRYSIKPEAGWADRYTVEDASGEVTAHLRGLGAFTYAADGRFRDAGRLEQAKLRHGDGRLVGEVADSVLEGATFRVEHAEAVVKALVRVLSEDTSGDSRSRARALKRLGQIHEALGRHD